MTEYIYVDTDSPLSRIGQLLTGDVLATDDKQQATYILEVAPGYYPSFTHEEIAEFLEWTLPKRTFDTLLLADVSTGATITRVQPLGTANVVAKPPLFKKRTQRGVSSRAQDKQIVVHDKGDGVNGILIAALLFFAVSVIALVMYAYRKNSTKRALE